MSLDLDDVEQHRQHLRTLCAPDGPLSAEGPRASVKNPAWFHPTTGDPRARRVLLHDELLREHRAASPDVAAERRAIVLAGPPGAGKSTLLHTELAGELRRWLWVDADQFKERLLKRAVADGSYEAFLKPAEVGALEEAGERFFPLELAPLVHLESSAVLARRAREDALERGENVVIDTVLSHPPTAVRLGEELAAHGYRVRVVDVETTFEISAERIVARWREQYVAALEGQPRAELGGRWVPSEYPRSLFTPDGSTCRSQESARRLAETCPNVLEYEVYRVTRSQPRPVRETALGRPRPGAPLMDAGPAAAVRRAQTGLPPHARDRGRGR